ncbi:hypothetical protein [Nocardia ninae]|uniref:hypothetical protein n=1 Tax=Nocardia ninae TaxID=356145 RepID=UPI0011BF074E|nr:hypothetical protein [Nocardia ninae]
MAGRRDAGRWRGQMDEAGCGGAAGSLLRGDGRDRPAAGRQRAMRDVAAGRCGGDAAVAGRSGRVMARQPWDDAAAMQAGGGR